MRRRIRWTAWILAASTALSASGCGEAPTVPNVTALGGPEVLVVGANGAAEYREAGGIESDATPSRALVVSKQVDGQKGGWVQCGRILLAIPEGAYDTTGVITVSMPDSNALLVNLEITPERLNSFAKPALLAVQTNGVDVDPESLAIYWYDPKGTWVDMKGDASLVKTQDCVTSLSSGTGSGPDMASWDRGLTAELWHFSKYSTGKAGW